MRKILIVAAVLSVMTGGGYAMDFADLSVFKVSDIKVTAVSVPVTDISAVAMVDETSTGEFNSLSGGNASNIKSKIDTSTVTASARDTIIYNGATVDCKSKRSIALAMLRAFSKSGDASEPRDVVRWSSLYLWEQASTL